MVSVTPTPNEDVFASNCWLELPLKPPTPIPLAAKVPVAARLVTVHVFGLGNVKVKLSSTDTAFNSTPPVFWTLNVKVML